MPVSASIFDLSDLVAFVSNHRNLTGIQRVQIGITKAALEDAKTVPVMLAAFVSELGCWRQIPIELFDRIAQPATLTDCDSTLWADVRNDLTLQMAVAPALVIPADAVLINLGTAWWLPNYLLAIRQLRSDLNLKYVQFVHDLVPVYAPGTCVPGLPRDFIGWLLSALSSTDLFLVNSDATERNLRGASDFLRQPLPPIECVPLDAFAPIEQATSIAEVPDEHFVLFVGTIEPRKNHSFAFSAWTSLVEERGAETSPLLVCVGRKGWMYEDAVARLDEPKLRGRVVVLEHVSDANLAALYRHALFTIYPSKCEGWGLPITELLAYGKIPIVPRMEPFTQAAGPFGCYFEPDSQTDFLDKI